MDSTLLVLAAIASTVVALATGVVSSYIVAKQKNLALRLEKMAGIERVEEIEGIRPLISLADALKKHEPKQSLRILVVSGASVIQKDSTLNNLLERGIDIEVMLLDPESDNWLFRQYPWLQDETRQSLNHLKEVAQSPRKNSRNLSIRLYPQPLLELLMFIDNEHLFLSSYFPIASSTRLIYQIRRGEQSIFKIYDEGFNFLWNSSSIHNINIE
ncbi:MAG TPA: hypothetical protein VF527_18340 [Pyrinomonadaceae bacterium]|jgi:hypothetical protein